MAELYASSTPPERNATTQSSVVQPAPVSAQPPASVATTGTTQAPSTTAKANPATSELEQAIDAVRQRGFDVSEFEQAVKQIQSMTSDSPNAAVAIQRTAQNVKYALTQAIDAHNRGVVSQATDFLKSKYPNEYQEWMQEGAQSFGGKRFDDSNFALAVAESHGPGGAWDFPEPKWEQFKSKVESENPGLLKDVVSRAPNGAKLTMSGTARLGGIPKESGLQEGGAVPTDWTGWEGGRTEILVPGGPEQPPIVEGTPAAKEYKAEIAAQKIIAEGKPIRSEELTPDVARHVTAILQGRGLEARYEAFMRQFTPKERAEIESGKYQVYSPEAKGFVATTKAIMEAREMAGYTAKELDEIYSGKYTIPHPQTGGPVAVTEKYLANYQKRQAVIAELRAGGFEQPPTMRGEYPEGGAPFESYEGAPPVYDIIGAIQSGFSISKLEVAFSKETVDRAQQNIADLETIGGMAPDDVLTIGTKAQKEAANRLIEQTKKAGLPRDLTTGKVSTERKRWVDLRTGEEYTDSERADIIKSNPKKDNEIALSLSEGSLANPEYLESLPGIWLAYVKGIPSQVGMTWPISRAITTNIGGIAVAVASIPIMLTSLGIRAVSKPTEIPGLAISTVKGMAGHIAATAAGIWSGKYRDDIRLGDLTQLAYDTALSYVIAEGGIKGAKGALAAVTTWVTRGGVPAGAVMKELSTGRIKTPDELAQNYAEALNEVTKQAATPGGKYTGKVQIKGTNLQLDYSKTPIQQVVGDVLFHGTKTEAGKGGVVKESLLTIAERSGDGKVRSYLTADAFTQMKGLADQLPQDVAKIDTPAVRTFNLADATDVPKALAPTIAAYIQSNFGRIYGSFVEWLKIEDANRPHDIDVVFRTDAIASKARLDMLELAKRAGYEARANERGVQIKVSGKWTTIVNIVSESQHASMLKGIFTPQETVIDGFRVETIGSQAVMQRLGSLVGDAKSVTREARLKKIAGTVSEIAENEGLVAELRARINQIIAGEGGLYTSPWAAIGYTRGGKNPGILMVLTDATKQKSGAKGLAEGTTQSAEFIREADKGFYGPSKTWRGDLETEVVGAPRTAIEVPPPTAGLFARLIAGKFADFFTNDGSRFVPIKIGLDVKSFKPETLAALKSPANWFAIRLWTAYNALSDTGRAFKHPGLMLKDVSGTLQQLFNINRYLREGAGRGGRTTFPGVRDVYLTTNWGKSIGEIARNIYDRAFKRTKEQLGKGVKEDTKAFRDAMERNMEDAYRANADALLRQFDVVAKAYTANPDIRSKFEASYMANLGLSVEALAKSSDLTESVSSRVAESVTSDRGIVSTVASRVASLPSMLSSSGVIESPISSAVTIETPSTETPSERTTESSSTETPSERTTESSSTETPSERTTETPTETPPTETPPDKTLPVMPSLRMVGGKAILPPGSITWASGELKHGKGKSRVPVWKWITPPFTQDKPYTLSGPPMGAVKAGSLSSKETIQMIGESGAPVPERVTIDNGMVDILIYDYGGKIEFYGGGPKTDYGKRIASTTQGMSVPESDTGGSDIYDTENPELGMSTQEGKSRAKVSKKKPRRTARRRDDFSDVTSLRGMRW